MRASYALATVRDNIITSSQGSSSLTVSYNQGDDDLLSACSPKGELILDFFNLIYLFLTSHIPFLLYKGDDYPHTHSPYPVYPVADGCARRIDGISRLLVAKGCKVFLFAPLSSKTKTREVLQESDIHLIHYSRKRKYNYFINIDLYRTLKKHIAKRPDLIILNFPYLSRIVFPIARKNRIPVHLDEHNIEHQRFKDMGRPFVAILIYIFERYAVNNARSVSVTSEIDAGTIKKKFGRESTVIENFIDVERFHPIRKKNKIKLRKSLNMDFPKIISYFGNFTNKSTKQAYKIIVNEIAPPLLLKELVLNSCFSGRNFDPA